MAANRITPSLTGSDVDSSNRTGYSHLPEMLPTEIRLMIFETALAHERSLMKPTDQSQHRVINTALLTVSRMVSSEAREAFLNVNTILLADQFNMSVPLADLRHVALTGDLAIGFFEGSATDLSVNLEKLCRLPRLKTLMLDCGGALRSGALIFGKSMSTLTNFYTANTNLGIFCVAIGLYQIKLPISSSTRVYLRYSKLIATLPRAQIHAHDYSIEKLFQNKIHYDPHGKDEWTGMDELPLEFTFAWFLACYEALRKLRRAESTISLVNKTNLAIWTLKAMISPLQGKPSTHDVVPPDDVRLDEVTLEGEGLAALEWASEVLCFYFARFEDGFIW